MEIVLLLIGLLVGVAGGWFARQATFQPAPSVDVDQVESDHQAEVERLAVAHERALTELRHELDRVSLRHQAELTEALAQAADSRAEVHAELTAAQATLEQLREALR